MSEYPSLYLQIWNHPDVLYEALQKENLASEQDLDLDDLNSNRCPAPGLKGKPADSANSRFGMPGIGILHEKANQVITYEWVWCSPLCLLLHT